MSWRITWWSSSKYFNCCSSGAAWSWLERGWRAQGWAGGPRGGALRQEQGHAGRILLPPDRNNRWGQQDIYSFRSGSALGISDLEKIHNFDVWHKILEGQWKYKNCVYIKPFFEIFSSFFHFWSIKFLKKFIVPSQSRKLFLVAKVEWSINLSSIYYSFRTHFFVDGEMCLVGLPLLLDSYCPWLAGLPLYILRLSTEVCGLFVSNL